MQKYWIVGWLFFFTVLRADPLDVQGIVIIGNGPSSTFEEQGIFFQNFDLPGLESCLSLELLPYLSCPLTEETLCSIKQTIAQFFEKQHRPLVLIFIPEQEIQEGKIHIQILESHLGETRVCHQRWTSPCGILSQIRLCQGGPIDFRTLAQDLCWLNRNLFREVDAIFTPGKQPCTTDVEFLVRDRLPIRLFTGVDNVGIPITGRTRYVAGIQGALFPLEHVLTYQFSSGNSYAEFHSHFLQYSLPLPWRNLLDLYGAYAHTQAEHSPFFSRGRNSLGSIRYTIPFFVERPWIVSDVGIGFDYKRTNNNLLFSDCPIFSRIVNLTQFVGFAHLGCCIGSHEWLCTVSLYGSPGNLTGKDGSTQHFQTLRLGSTNRYLYVNADFHYQYCSTWSFILGMRGQGASANLLPSEQLGLGGFASVRGYDEHEINKDNGLLINVELRTPRIALIDRWHLRDYDEGLQLLIFSDCGMGINHKGGSWQTLAGIGPGIRYVIDPYVTFRFDFGIQLKKLFENHAFASRIHFAFFLHFW